MIERPEKIAVAVYLVCVGFLVLAAWLYASTNSIGLREAYLPLLALTVVAVTVELPLRRLPYYVVTLVFHASFIVIALRVVEARSAAAEIALVSTFTLNVGLRFRPRTAIPVVGVVVVGTLATTLATSGVLSREPAVAALPRALTVAAVHGLILWVWELVVLYRERLVRTEEMLAAERAALRNLSAANESFVQELPEIRKASAEVERLRITRELHDSLGYSMTNIVMIMNAAQYLFASQPDTVRDYCRRTKELAAATMEETRDTLYKLRAVRHSPESPAMFFIKMCHDFEEATGVRTECHAGNLSAPLPDSVFGTLLRSVQVGLINALKHGKATHIQLFFWIAEEALRMTVWNSVDPTVVEPGPEKEGIGLRGVHERVAELSGTVEAGYEAHGFALRVTIPSKELEDHADTSSDR